VLSAYENQDSTNETQNIHERSVFIRVIIHIISTGPEYELEPRHV